MHYDEATGDMIGDDDSYMSAPYRSECSPNASVWRERISGIIKYLLLLVACWFIGRYIGECRPRDKIEEWWRSFSGNQISSEEQNAQKDAASQQEDRFFVICWRCNEKLDATHLKHLMSFDGECPCCNAQLHVEQCRQ